VQIEKKMLVEIKCCVESTNQNVAWTQPISMFSTQVPNWTSKKKYYLASSYF